MIKTIKTQTVNSKLHYSDNDQKYGRKHLGRTYETIPLPPRSFYKKNKKET